MKKNKTAIVKKSTSANKWGITPIRFAFDDLTTIADLSTKYGLDKILRGATVADKSNTPRLALRVLYMQKQDLSVEDVAKFNALYEDLFPNAPKIKL